MIYMDFIESITKDLDHRIRSYAGGMLVNVVHNYQGGEIAVVWSNAQTGATEVYRFPVVGGEEYTENVNNGSDYSSYKFNFIEEVFSKMVDVESIQTGRPAAL